MLLHRSLHPLLKLLPIPQHLLLPPPPICLRFEVRVGGVGSEAEGVGTGADGGDGDGLEDDAPAEPNVEGFSFALTHPDGGHGEGGGGGDRTYEEGR